MIKEQIANEAREWSSTAFGKGGHFAKEDALMLARISAGRKAFQAGIEWFLEHLFHDADEVPDFGEQLLVDFKEGGLDYSFNFKDAKGWKEFAKDMDIVKWAYVRDIYPKRGGCRLPDK